MRLISTTHSSDENYGPTAIVFTISADEAVNWLAAMKLLQAVKDYGRFPIAHLSGYGGSADAYEFLPDWLEESSLDEDVHRLPDEGDCGLDDDETIRTDCHMIQIHEHAIYFILHNKHGSGCYETRPVTEVQLTAIAEGHIPFHQLTPPVPA